VPDRHLGLGLGIHGEPGISDIPMMSATELAELLVTRVLEAAPTTGTASASKRVGAILNGLGTTKYEELFLLWGHVSRLLRDAGYDLVDPEVGELVTSLDMGGCSLTLIWLDEELERLWRADTYTPAYRKQRGLIDSLRGPGADELADTRAVVTAPAATPAAQAFAQIVRAALDVMRRTLHDNEIELGRIDAVAGDGDHGRGMVKGINAAVERVAELPGDAGGGWLLTQAGQAWAERAGGTSGVLWGAALESFGHTVGDDGADYDAVLITAGVRAFLDAITTLGGAKAGDKTLLDALIPFVESLESATRSGTALSQAWPSAAEIATRSALETANLRPQVGRARPLAEKSVGTPDAGATSMALLVTALGQSLTSREIGREREGIR
jgi:dihydroxyacetone kinase